MYHQENYEEMSMRISELEHLFDKNDAVSYHLILLINILSQQFIYKKLLFHKKVTKSNRMDDSQVTIFRKILENFEKRLETVEKVNI